jgi:hypothetical protein
MKTNTNIKRKLQQVCNLIKHNDMTSLLFYLAVFNLTAHYLWHPADGWLAKQLPVPCRTKNALHNGITKIRDLLPYLKGLKYETHC